MSTHMNRLVSSSFHRLRWIPANSDLSIPTSMAIQLVNSFVVSRIDSCNSLLVGLPDVQLDRKQSVLNYAVRIIYGPGKYDHVTPFLRDKLHWLSGSSESAIQMLHIDVQVDQRTGFFIHVQPLHKRL